MKTSFTDFRFQFVSYGHYRVYYTSPKTTKRWSVLTTDMPLIDSTLNSDAPLQKDLDLLKWTCKNN